MSDARAPRDLSAGQSAPLWETGALPSWLPFVAAVVGLLLGGVAYLLGETRLAGFAWAGATVAVLVPAAWVALRRLLHADLAVDLIGVASMAVALMLDELLAGAIIALMMSGGVLLEDLALARARRELTALLARAPRLAHRQRDGAVVDVAIDEVSVGDVLLVKPAEVLPADGVLLSPSALLDASALTGEAAPVSHAMGAELASGTVNVGALLELRATARAADSTYAAVTRLVRDAEHSKAPYQRLADHYSVWFLGLTTLACAVAWAASGDPHRALAVLVVATPCPLLLAVPVALMAGVSRAARHGVLVKGGRPLELLARARVLLLDKTGTVTTSTPQVLSVESFGARSEDELVRVACALEELSIHPYAPAILAEGRTRGLLMVRATEIHEELGAGMSGLLEGKHVALGQLAYVAHDGSPSPAALAAVRRSAIDSASPVFVAVDDVVEGMLLLNNPIRVEAPRVIQQLRRAGLTQIHLLTGDHPDVAELMGDAIGADRVFAERTPAEKLMVVQRMRTHALTIMVGDGINDAPALALADVGIAMGTRASAASQAADVVLLGDRLDGLSLARRIATETLSVARLSLGVGMGLSLLAMLAAGLGLLRPVHGALLQEGIDLLVILHALRALGPRKRAPSPAMKSLARDLGEQHAKLRPQVQALASLATRIDRLPPESARQALEQTRLMLERDLLPHERSEQRLAYPKLRALAAPEDPTGPLIQTHHEISRLARLYGRLVDQLPPEGPDPDTVRDLRRSLYGLHAILSLHFAQEDELYSLLQE